jgi:hypothetical protein
VWFFSRHVLLLLTFFLLYTPNYQVSGQDVEIISSTIIYPETFLPDATIEYRKNGDFDYYIDGIRVGGGRQRLNGTCELFHKGRLEKTGILYNKIPKTQPKTDTNTDTDVDSTITNSNLSRPIRDRYYDPNNPKPRYAYQNNATVVRDGERETIRSTINTTTYDNTGKPYYRWNSEEKSTSHIKDPRVVAKVRYAQGQEDARQRAADRKR